jgi:tRNA A37 threonylcarbamoyladenosine synthetase subunit TsaC/SUA5/YrdC
MSFVDEFVGLRSLNPERITLVEQSLKKKPETSSTADNQKTNVTRVPKHKIREVCMQDAISLTCLIYIQMLL